MTSRTASDLAGEIADMIGEKTEQWDRWIEGCTQGQLLEIVETVLAMCSEEER